MTLAYVFWHHPGLGVDAAGYERGLLAFHARLADAPIPGTLGCRTVRVPATPWLSGAGYEDWYFVEDFTALGQLNAGAIDEAHAAVHDDIAAQAGFGAGGLYRLVSGQRDRAGAHHVWFPKPDVLPGGEGTTLWQRQLVLSPAPEFCLVCDERPILAGAVDVPVERL